MLDFEKDKLSEKSTYWKQHKLGVECMRDSIREETEHFSCILKKPTIHQAMLSYTMIVLYFVFMVRNQMNP